MSSATTRDDQPADRRKTLLLVDDSPVNRQLLTQLFGEHYALLEAEEGTDAIQYLRQHDDLTGHLNRKAFTRQVAQLVQQQPPNSYVLSCLDIDGFKVINDRFGHEEGDRLLRFVAQQQREELAAVGGVACRDMADLFFTLMPNDAAMLEDSMQRFSARLRRYNLPMNIEVHVGRYVVDDVALDVNHMLDRALLATRSIKGSSDTHVAWFSDDMRQHVLREQTLVGQMRDALAQRQFVVYYQPQYNYASGSLSGAEALVRWKHPEEGLIPPGEFIPLFEKNNFITALDEFVWEEVCRQQREWLDRGIKVVPVSVNISRRDVRNPKLADMILALVEKYRLEPRLLNLEITESAYVENPQQLICTIHQLESYGFSVEMDDFGSGYSSLNTLKDVPVSVLKLDMKFVGESGSHSRGGSILSSVVRMAHWLKLPVIAEGVETRQQADYLKSIGCHLMQGYYFAHPMPGEDYTALLLGAHKTERWLKRSGETDIKGAAEFLDASTQATLLFNSFVGGAYIAEYNGINVEALRCNDRFFEILGCTREEYGDNRLHILQRMHLSSQQAYIQALQEAIRSGRETECELCTYPIRKGAGTIWTKNRFRFLARNGTQYVFYVSVENITKRKLLERQLLAESEKNAAIIANSPGGGSTLAVTDDGIQCEAFSDGVCRLLGYTREQMEEHYRQHLLDIVPPGQEDATVEALREIARDGREFSRDFRLRHSGGDYLWVNLSGHPVRGADGVLRFYCTYSDVTEQKRSAQRFAKELRSIAAISDDRVLAKLQADLTGNRCEVVETSLFPGEPCYDDCVDAMLTHIVTSDQRRRFCEVFRRDALLRAYDEGHTTQRLDYLYTGVAAHRPVWVRTVGRVYRDPAEASIKLFSYTYNVDDEVNNAVIARSVMHSVCETVSIIYLDSGCMHNYVRSPLEERLGVGTDDSYIGRLDSFISHYIRADQQARAKERLSLRTVCAALEKDASYQTVLPVIDGGAVTWRRWAFFPLDRQHAQLAMIRTDVTEWESLRYQKETLDLVLRSNNTVLCRYVLKDKTLYLPADIAELLGIPARLENFPDGSTLVSAASRQAYQALLHQIQQGVKNGSDTLQFHLPTRRSVWLYITFNTEFDEKGTPVGAIVSFKDVTQSRMEEIENQRSRLLIEENHLAIFDYDYLSDTLYLDVPRAEHGIVKREYSHFYTYIAHTSHVTLDASQTLRRLIRTCAEKPVSGSVEYEGNTWGTGYRWCRMDYSSLADESGRVYRMVGQVRDIQAEHNRAALIEKLLNDPSHVLRRSAAYNHDPLIITQIFRYLYEAENTDAAVGNVLALLGAYYGVSRVYIFEDDPAHRYVSNTFEWCAEGVTPEKENLQHILFGEGEMSGFYPDSFADNDVLLCTDIQTLPPATVHCLEQQGVCGVLQCLLRSGEQRMGFIGFDDCTGSVVWTDEMTSTLSMAAMLIETFLIKWRATPSTGQRSREHMAQMIAKHARKYLMLYDFASDSLRRLEDDANTIPNALPLYRSPRDYLLHGVIARESEEDVKACFTRMRTGGKDDFVRFRAKSLDGTWRWFAMTASVVADEQNQPDYAIVSVEDITDVYEKELAFRRYKSLMETPESDRGFFLDYNLTQNSLEGHSESFDNPVFLQLAQKGFAACMRALATGYVCPPDQVLFRRAFSAPRLLGCFAKGVTQESMDVKFHYMPHGDPIYARMSCQMTADPFTGNTRLFFSCRVIDREKRAELALRNRADYDAVTGVLSRGAFVERTQERLEQSTPGLLYAFALLDIDHFKDVNDSFGHVEGDRILRTMAETVQDALSKGDLMGRLGGDEFGLLLGGFADEEALERRLSALSAALILTPDDTMHITGSIGVALYPRHGTGFDTLYPLADRALYHVKEHGRNHYAVFTPDMMDRSDRPQMSGDEGNT